MTKSDLKFFKNLAKAKANDRKIRKFYENFAEENDAVLTDFEVIDYDAFGDGIPRCVTVFQKKNS